MRTKMNAITVKDTDIFLPQPVLPIIEDVGWWQGEDGSAQGQPYRNNFPRPHCLEDYLALIRFARKLGIRLPIGMVLCEWDRDNLLARIPHATWMGQNWDNRKNCGPWLDEAVHLINDHGDSLEIGLHGLCHEFWHKDSTMERAEFHNSQGIIRPKSVITAHLEAFVDILRQNNFTQFPRIFIPPALHHSFGNGSQSMQAILHEFGIHYVVTRFARARRFRPPRHELMTWECSVGLLERGLAPVSWSKSAASPVWDCSGPILPLHWGNLLHPDPCRNAEIVDAWADMLLRQSATSPHRLLAKDMKSCWRQMAIWAFGKLERDSASIVVDRTGIPVDMPDSGGSFFVTTSRQLHQRPKIAGARLLHHTGHTLEILPDQKAGNIRIFFN